MKKNHNLFLFSTAFALIVSQAHGSQVVEEAQDQAPQAVVAAPVVAVEAAQTQAPTTSWFSALNPLNWFVATNVALQAEPVAEVKDEESLEDVSQAMKNLFATQDNVDPSLFRTVMPGEVVPDALVVDLPKKIVEQEPYFFPLNLFLAPQEVEKIIVVPKVAKAYGSPMAEVAAEQAAPEAVAESEAPMIPAQDLSDLDTILAELKTPLSDQEPDLVDTQLLTEEDLLPQQAEVKEAPLVEAIKPIAAPVVEKVKPVVSEVQTNYEELGYGVNSIINKTMPHKAVNKKSKAPKAKGKAHNRRKK